MQFRSIVGQEEIKERLRQTVKDNRVSHAQLFLGPAGSGALALALAYAQYICCENKQEADSCGVCPACRKYSRLIHPDLHFSYPFFARHKEDTALSFLPEWREAFLDNPYLGLDEWRSVLDAENKQANINIAECHQIIHKLSLKPFESDYKVLIMWLPEYLDKVGNTLLKIIEEPSDKTLFLLVAENQDQILNTILSRTQLVKIGRLGSSDIINYLVAEKGFSADKAARAAYLGEGNLQAALRMPDGEESDNFRLFSEWMRMTYADKAGKILDFTEKMAKAGRENQKNFLRYGIHLIRESIMINSAAGSLIHLPEAERDFITNFSKFMDIAKAQAIAVELEKAHYHVERNANPRILFLDVSLQFVRIFNFNTIPEGTQHILN